MRLFDALFKCLHRRTTFPMSNRRPQDRPSAEQIGTHVVCLDCGTEFAYDWNKMCIQPPEKRA
jgi:hypothetical protein